MKAVTYLLVVLSLLWIDVAYRAAMAGPPPVIVVYRVAAQPANYVVPAHECSRMCRAKTRSTAVSVRFALKEGK